MIEDNHLYYYDKNGNKTDLGDLGDLGLLETDPDLFVIDDGGGINLKYYWDYYHRTKEWTVENLVIPKEINGINVTSILTYFHSGGTGVGKMNGSENLKTVIMPDSVVEIGSNTFRECINLTKVEFSNSLRKIGSRAFYECINLIDIKLPDSLIEIEHEAFQACSKLQMIRIPKSVQTIGKNAFYGCENLKTIIVVRNGDETLEGAPWGAENANVIYVEADYEKFANDYVKNKNQDEVEELILKTTGFLGTFDEYLQEEVQMTRDEFEQMGTEYYGMTYLDALKFSLVYAMREGSWIQVEYQVNLNGGSGKTVEELEELFLQNMIEKGENVEELEQFLEQEGLTLSQYLQQIAQQEGFRTEEDFLKVILYYM